MIRFSSPAAEFGLSASACAIGRLGGTEPAAVDRSGPAHAAAIPKAVTTTLTPRPIARCVSMVSSGSDMELGRPPDMRARPYHKHTGIGKRGHEPRRRGRRDG